MDPFNPIIQAREEFAQEQFRDAVDAEKARLREQARRRPWWQRLFPWTITIKRRDR